MEGRGLYEWPFMDTAAESGVYDPDGAGSDDSAVQIYSSLSRMSGRPPKVPEVGRRFPQYERTEKFKAIVAAQAALFNKQPIDYAEYDRLDAVLDKQEIIDYAEYKAAKEKHFAALKNASVSLRTHGIAASKRKTKSKTKSKGGGCGCGLRGGYRATRRNKTYLALWKKGKPIGFTMRSSLKAKGLIPRANGRSFVSAKYR